ncbi:hypothetical protein BJ912DRAFT_969516 [Pholiota molesta]|nr:hypothetical protein BJ912DRAFT_969516 [Pholiota molesta]
MPKIMPTWPLLSCSLLNRLSSRHPFSVRKRFAIWARLGVGVKVTVETVTNLKSSPSVSMRRVGWLWTLSRPCRWGRACPMCHCHGLRLYSEC